MLYRNRILLVFSSFFFDFFLILLVALNILGHFCIISNPYAELMHIVHTTM